MTNAGTLTAEIAKETNLLVDRLASFSDENFTKKPAPDKWSAAEVAEHLIICETQGINVLHGDTSPTEREPDERVAMMRGLFVSTDNKFEAGPAIAPSGKITNKNEAIRQLAALRNQLIEETEKPGLAETCMSAKHPGFGRLTRLEWISFSLIHAERHMLQLDRIAAAV